MTQYYTYTLKDSTDNLPFYVGKGSNTRMYQHKEEALREGYQKRSVHCKILSILNKGGEILYEKVEQPNEEIAFDLEIELIKKYGRKDNGTGILCNLTDGGEGQNRSRESVAKVAAWHTGRKRSEESKQRMSRAQIKHANKNRELYGTGVKPETILKMSASRKGKSWSENARNVKRNKPTAKIVLAFIRNTNIFVGEYESIALCAKNLNVDTTAVWRICEGTPCSKSSSGKLYPMKSYKGYTFKYKV